MDESDEERGREIDHGIVSFSVVVDHCVLELLSPTLSSSSPALCRRQQQCVLAQRWQWLLLFIMHSSTQQSKCTDATLSVQPLCLLCNRWTMREHTEYIFFLSSSHAECHWKHLHNGPANFPRTFFLYFSIMFVCVLSVVFSSITIDFVFESKKNGNGMAETARFAVRTEKCTHFKWTFHELGTKSEQTAATHTHMVRTSNEFTLNYVRIWWIAKTDHFLDVLRNFS